MGLDITAYKKLKAFNGQYNDGTDEVLNVETGLLVGWDDYFKPCINRNYVERATDVNEDQFYTFEDSIGFRAGSYGGYNNWREQLAKLAGYPCLDGEGDRHLYSNGAWKAHNGAFWELINFSDCEGVIGTEVSKKLLKDFIDFEESAKQVGGYFHELYNEWKTAFEYAGENGAVDFH
ncbi:hypothetical protein [Acinetobacter guillouiae]|uniref:hypothetical protein n=1 Tax=Acinetobacter guillouiae TaxID=106649 RepID=UPI003008ACA8